MTQDDLRKVIELEQQKLKDAKTENDKLWAQYKINCYQERLERLIERSRFDEKEKTQEV